MAELLSIPEFYAGREIFITGGSGFMGKVLIEKLLRSCPDVKIIFLLMRAKKGMTPEERIDEMMKLPLFEILNNLDPSAKSKLVPIDGDVRQEGLGISEKDVERLMDVSIIFHVAASVRFDEPLRDAILMNTKGTQQVLELALKMKKIKVILHVSTTFCNCDRLLIDEKLYPAHADWRKTLEIVEKIDSHTLSVLSDKFIGKLPNTYTFAKSLAEHVVKDYQHLLPIVIFRPSIVIASWKEPVEGWIDNFNGPVGLIIAGGKGLLRSLHCDKDISQDYIPVDVAIKAAIVATWKRGITQSPPEELPIYNCSSFNTKLFNLREINENGKRYTEEYPLSDILWPMNTTLTKCPAMHYINVIFFHLLPALLIDLVLKISKKKPFLTRLQKRIYVANSALSFFMMRSWSFPNKNYQSLEKELLPQDKESFGYDISSLDTKEYFVASLNAGRVYLLKEGPETYAASRRHSRRMYWLDKIVKAFFMFLICYIFYNNGCLHAILNSTSYLLKY